MNVAILGCGLIGNKRAAHLPGGKLWACADIDRQRAEALAAKYPGCAAHTDWRAAIATPGIDAVIICTRPDLMVEMTSAALSAGKHVLVEKPAARSAEEIEPVVTLARQMGKVARVGFNHRFHRAFRQARELVDSGVLGDLMYLRARYGHGGRLGYEKEWRADPQLSGGGELIDQGVHLIDLSRWFLGDVDEVHGFAGTWFWKMPVDDNAFVLLKSKGGQAAFLHASCTEWKNLFSFELFGRDGKLQVDGLGGSYGVERLTLYKMLPQMGPPETTSWEYPMADDSWSTEFEAFCEDVKTGRAANPSLEDARAALQVVARIYKER